LHGRHTGLSLVEEFTQADYRGRECDFCNDNPRDEVVVTFFQTDPPTLVVERGDQVSLMYLQPSGSGSKYQGRNESFWEHHGEAIGVWGYGSPEMRCKKRSIVRSDRCFRGATQSLRILQ